MLGCGTALACPAQNVRTKRVTPAISTTSRLSFVFIARAIMTLVYAIEPERARWPTGALRPSPGSAAGAGASQRLARAPSAAGAGASQRLAQAPSAAGALAAVAGAL